MNIFAIERYYHAEGGLHTEVESYWSTLDKAQEALARMRRRWPRVDFNSYDIATYRLDFDGLGPL